MDSEFSNGDRNFEFAFNSSNFSDRVLRIEICTGSPEGRKNELDGQVDACSSIDDWRDRKRRRGDHIDSNKG